MARGPSLAERLGTGISAAARAGAGRARPVAAAHLRRGIGLVRTARSVRIAPWFGPLLFGLIIVPPALLWAGAALLTVQEGRRAAAIRADSAPALAAIRQARADRAARAAIAPAFAVPTIGAATRALAEALPPDAELLSLTMAENGAAAMTLAAPDPDALRAALRGRAPLTGFRETDQAVGADGRMRITLTRPAR